MCRGQPSLSRRSGLADAFFGVGAFDKVRIVVVQICSQLHGQTKDDPSGKQRGRWATDAVRDEARR